MGKIVLIFIILIFVLLILPTDIKNWCVHQLSQLVATTDVGGHGQVAAGRLCTRSLPDQVGSNWNS